MYVDFVKKVAVGLLWMGAP